jgi:hypothetical protein
MELFERVVLLKDLTGTKFIKGDVATIVEIYTGGKGYELEFFAADGTTLGVETVAATAIKSTKGIKGVLHIHNIAT